MLKLSLVVLLHLSSGMLYGFNSTSDITFIIESLPANTPDKDTIFVCGNFNDWKINDPEYALHRRTDGKLYVRVPFNTDTLQFKFSRGDWMNMETGSDNNYIPNRILTDQGQLTSYFRVENWQDLGGRKSIPFYIFTLSAGILNGLLLIFILLRIQNADKYKVIAFGIWTLYLMLIFAGIIVYELSNIVQKFRLLLMFQVGLTLAGPLFFRIYNSFYQTTGYYSTLHFIPTITILTIAIHRTFNLLPDALFIPQINIYLTVIDFVIILAATTIFFCYLVFIAIKTPKHSHYNQNPTDSYWLKFFPEILNTLTPVQETPANLKLKFGKMFIFHLTIINLLTVIAGIALFVIYAKAQTTVPDLYHNILFSFAAIQILSSFYFIISNETLFTQRKEELKNTEQPDLLLLDKIRQVIIAQKPYKNPDLLLSDFTEMVNSKPHIVSKVINDCFHHNFRDFINEFRIKEFIDLMNSNKKQNLTYLYLAYEAGFNSKSTFNLAFKKSTGLSPREYFKKHQSNIA